MQVIPGRQIGGCWVLLRVVAGNCRARFVARARMILGAPMALGSFLWLDFYSVAHLRD